MLSNLPEELLLQVFSFLSIDDLVRVSMVSKFCGLVLLDASLWIPFGNEMKEHPLFKELNSNQSRLNVCGNKGNDGSNNNNEINVRNLCILNHKTCVNWKRGKYKCKEFERAHSKSVFRVTFRDDVMLSCAEDGIIKVWNLETGKVIKNIMSNFGWVYSVEFLPNESYRRINNVDYIQNNNLFVSGGQEKVAKLWEVGNSSPLMRYTGHQSTIRCFETNLQGKIVSGGFDNKILIFDVETGQTISILEGHTGSVLSLSYSCGYLISSAADYSTRVWDVNQLHCVGILNVHTDKVNAVKFDPTQHQVISGSSDLTIKVCDLRTYMVVNELIGHRWHVTSLDYEKNTGKLISGSSDASIRVWDINSGSSSLVLEKHRQTVSSVKFDWRKIVSGSWDNSIKIFDFSL